MKDDALTQNEVHLFERANAGSSDAIRELGNMIRTMSGKSFNRPAFRHALADFLRNCFNIDEDRG